MDDNIETISTQKLMLELSNLDKKIDLLILKHEIIRKELIKRYPLLEESETFQSKINKK